MKDSKELYSNFQNAVLNGNFEEAYVEMQNLSFKEVESELVRISIYTLNLLPYAFLVFALEKKPEPMLCVVCADLFINSYNVWDGSMKVAQLYAEKALVLDGNCVDAWAVIMYLGICPDSDLTREDMINARKKIEEIDPNSDYLKEKAWY